MTMLGGLMGSAAHHLLFPAHDSPVSSPRHAQSKNNDAESLQYLCVNLEPSDRTRVSNIREEKR